MAQVGDNQKQQGSQPGLGPTGYMWNGVQNPYTQYSQEGNTANWAIQGLLAQGWKPEEITPNLLAQVLPTYMSTDPNKANVAGGDAFVASLKQQQDNTPQNIYKQQQQGYIDQYNTNKGSIDSQVSGAFQSMLGRAPTADESQHFGMLIASGEDPYQVQQALQQTTEYQNAQTQKYTDQQAAAQQKQTAANEQANQKFISDLTPQLQQSNADYFSKYIMPSIQANAGASGRSLDSSGVSSQLANAGQQQNYQLQNYLAQLSGNLYGSAQQASYGQQSQLSGLSQQQFAGAQSNARDQYGQLLSQQYGLQNAGVSNQLANNAANTQYGQNMSMYQMQQQSYNNYLNNYGKRSGSQGIGSAVGGVLGGAAGAYFGGPMGATAGYQMGSGAGSAAGAFF